MVAISPNFRKAYRGATVRGALTRISLFGSGCAGLGSERKASEARNRGIECSASS